MARVRLDRLLVNRGWFESREQARRAIIEGRIRVNGVVARRPGKLVGPDERVDHTPPPEQYVSRGGYKLAHALDVFGIPVEGCRALDIGASTGGFTDCLLQRGAAQVIAVDVGYGQLAWRLRQDPRVVVIERCNARNLTLERIGEPVELIVVDVSFISLRLILPPARECLLPDGHLVSLVKPQFEAQREDVGKGGIVRDSRVHARVLRELCSAGPDFGLYAIGVTTSPLLGAKGNREFLVHWRPVGCGVEPLTPEALTAFIEAECTRIQGERGR